MTNKVQIRGVCDGDSVEWVRLRTALWPDAKEDHATEVNEYFRNKSFTWSPSFLAAAVFVATRPNEGLCGFVEASIRSHVDGCESSPIGYVEGWFVDSDMRLQGIGRALVQAAERWAAKHGCQEMASDAHLDNIDSLHAHKALDFDESSRTVHFRKRLSKTDQLAEGAGLSARRQRLQVVAGSFTICKLPQESPIPAWAMQSDFFSVTRTSDELSIVCRGDQVPEGINSEKDWRCLRVADSMPFTAVGVLASMTAPLATAGISLFAISTFDTDYLLVKAHDFERTIGVLQAAGHEMIHEDHVGRFRGIQP